MNKRSLGGSLKAPHPGARGMKPGSLEKKLEGKPVGEGRLPPPKILKDLKVGDSIIIEGTRFFVEAHNLSGTTFLRRADGKLFRVTSVAEFSGRVERGKTPPSRPAKRPKAAKKTARKRRSTSSKRSTGGGGASDDDVDDGDMESGELRADGDDSDMDMGEDS